MGKNSARQCALKLKADPQVAARIAEIIPAHVNQLEREAAQRVHRELLTFSRKRVHLRMIAEDTRERIAARIRAIVLDAKFAGEFEGDTNTAMSVEMVAQPCCTAPAGEGRTTRRTAVLLNAKHERFAQLITSGHSTQDAYREVYETGGKVARDSARKLRNEPEVAARIAQIREQQREELERQAARGVVYEFLTLERKRELLCGFVEDPKTKATERMLAIEADGKLAREFPRKSRGPVATAQASKPPEVSAEEINKRFTEMVPQLQAMGWDYETAQRMAVRRMESGEWRAARVTG